MKMFPFCKKQASHRWASKSEVRGGFSAVRATIAFLVQRQVCEGKALNDLSKALFEDALILTTPRLKPVVLGMLLKVPQQ
jgi:hypothetical protein